MFSVWKKIQGEEVIALKCGTILYLPLYFMWRKCVNPGFKIRKNVKNIINNCRKMCYTRIIRIESFQHLPIFPFILLGKPEVFSEHRNEPSVGVDIDIILFFGYDKIRIRNRFQIIRWGK